MGQAVGEMREMTKPFQRTRNIIIGVVLMLVVFLSGFLTGNVIHGPLTVTTTRTEVVSVTLTSTKVVSETTSEGGLGQWRELYRFAGTKDVFNGLSEPFDVPYSNWRIRWSYVGTPSSSSLIFFTFGVYPEGQEGNSVARITSTEQTASAITYVQTPGVFRLSMLTTSITSWTIVIEVPA